MKILISPIGNHDPCSPDGKEGAALTICRHLEPDTVYLLPTAKRPDVKDSTYDKALETEEQIQGIFPNTKVYIRDLNVWDPTDFSQILPKIRDILFRIIDEMRFEPNRAFYINATSATPQIQASCILAVTSGTIEAKVLQVANPQYAPAPERVREMPITLLQEDSLLEKANRFFEKLMFDACAEELKSLEALTLSRTRRDGAEIWCLLCECYSALDRLNYAESRDRMRPLTERTKGTYQFQPVEDLLQEQFETLKQLSESSEKEKENKLILSDIYHNAHRCFCRGAYADTLARAWRLLEGGMFYYLRDKYGIEPTYLCKSPCLESCEAGDSAACDVVDKLTEEGYKDLSFESSRIVLEERLCDEQFCEFLSGKCRRGDVRKLMNGLRENRNKSVAAHGVKPVSREVAQSSLELAEHFLRFVFPDLDLDEYLFADKKLLSIGQNVRQAI